MVEGAHVVPLPVRRGLSSHRLSSTPVLACASAQCVRAVRNMARCSVCACADGARKSKWRWPAQRTSSFASVAARRDAACTSGIRTSPARELHPAAPSTRLRAQPCVCGAERVFAARSRSWPEKKYCAGCRSAGNGGDDASTDDAVDRQAARCHLRRSTFAAARARWLPQFGRTPTMPSIRNTFDHRPNSSDITTGDRATTADSIAPPIGIATSPTLTRSSGLLGCVALAARLVRTCLNMARINCCRHPGDPLWGQLHAPDMP